MAASTRFLPGMFHALTSPGVDYALTDTMTQLSLLLAWKLTVYLAPRLKLELSTWGINLAGSLNRYLPSHTNWTEHTHVHKYCADVKEEVKLLEQVFNLLHNQH